LLKYWQEMQVIGTKEFITGGKVLMRTFIVTETGEKFRALFSHFREDIHDDFYNILSEHKIKAYESGQVKDYLRHPNSYFVINRLVIPRLFVVDAIALTKCRIVNDKKELITEGFSFCSIKDQFNKSIGCKISLSRAIKELKKRNIVCQKIEYQE